MTDTKMGINTIFTHQSCYFVETNLNIGIWNYINDLSCVSTAESFSNTYSKKLIKIVDVFGRETSELKNTPLFYLYEGGLVEKKIIIE